ncbi:MAG: hypothetical protein EP326_10795 [Deltaproteobacteria bacterium]|nr:MAG: hypothetical protein EP326_10795 [Deltaproteobacteria bacterium]
MNEELKKIFNQGNLVVYILWGALTFSQLIYAFLIFMHFMGDPGKDFEMISSSPLALGNVLILICFVAALLSAYFFNKNRDIVGLEQEMKAMDTKLDPNLQLTPGQFEILSNASTDTMKFYNLRGRILTRYILSWAFNEVLAICGVIGTVFGMERVHAYTFIATGITLNILMFPKVKEQFERLAK